MNLLRVVSCIAFFSVASTANAAGLVFLRDSPMSHFNNEDMAILVEQTEIALNEAADGELREWKNEKTGAMGSIKVLDSIEGKTEKCRNVAFTTAYKTLFSKSEHKLCLQPNGKWKIPAASGKVK